MTQKEKREQKPEYSVWKSNAEEMSQWLKRRRENRNIHSVIFSLACLSGLNDSKGEERTETAPGSITSPPSACLNDSKGEERTETYLIYQDRILQVEVSMTQKEKREQKPSSFFVCIQLTAVSMTQKEKREQKRPKVKVRVLPFTGSQWLKRRRENRNANSLGSLI